MATKKKSTRKKSTTKRKGKSNAGTAKLKKIVAKAKTIYKKGASGKKWTNCIKEASKQV